MRKTEGYMYWVYLSLSRFLRFDLYFLSILYITIMLSTKKYYYALNNKKIY